MNIVCKYLKFQYLKFCPVTPLASCLQKIFWKIIIQFAVKNKISGQKLVSVKLFADEITVDLEYVCSVVSDSFETLWTVALPGSSVHGISQARILEWVAISSSRGIFLTQGSNLCLLCYCALQADSLLVSHQEGPFLKTIKLLNFVCTVCCIFVCFCNINLSGILIFVSLLDLFYQDIGGRKVLDNQDFVILLGYS